MELNEKIKEALENPKLYEMIAEEIRNDDSGKIPESLKSQPSETLVELSKIMVREMQKDKLIRIIEETLK